jgi:hypothetical protein
MAELVEATRRNEVGMLDNQWAISDDRQVCHIYERFQDSAAVMTHLQWFGANFAERFMKILKPTRVVVYGTPSVEVKNAFAEFNPSIWPRLEALDDKRVLQCGVAGSKCRGFHLQSSRIRPGLELTNSNFELGS